MSPYLRSAFSLIILMLLAATPAIDANSGGKTGSSSSGCSCHYSGASVSPSMSGLPTAYTPSTTYSLTWNGGGTTSGQGGFNLDASSGSWSNLGARVQSSSGELTHSSDLQRSWTADWTAPAAGTGDVSFDLAVLYADGNGQNSNDNWGTQSWTVPESVSPPNTPPVASDVFISITGESAILQAYYDEELVASYTYMDDENDAESGTLLRWSKDSSVVSQRNDFMNVPASYTSIGDVWSLVVTPNDGMDLGSAVSASTTVEIIDYDADNDGYGDQSDAFPEDPNEHADSDSDGVGDNADAFPNDSTETTDTDGDGTGDNGDAFPNDATESMDSDMDGVGDNADAFPNDALETTDSDMDGVGDNADVFPNDANETMDSDMDGVGNNADAFPNDASETMDSDMDGVGDNADVFPNDATETMDSDMDGVGNNGDAFPNDASETMDSDMDGVGDNADVFPNDANETVDSDMDGVGDNGDAFPNNALESADSDDDGVGDNADAFPSDANETIDSDMDGVGDNGDAFPNDATESADSDDDGVGDNADAFPNDAAETMDSDMDGVGDNSDAFPNDAAETVDTDMDGVGDNADAFPEDASETLDSDGDGVGDNAQLAAETLAAEEEAAQKQMLTMVGIGLVVVIGIAGAVLFMRNRGEDANDELTKDYMPQTEQALNLPIQQTQQQVVSQPVVAAEPTVVRQWTDEAGYTWRAMDDGSNYWWTGTEWKRS
ncbi:MAG: hypothetical protein L7U62_00160 [Candidatus Poseidoniaceae archaeon]|nr:hypothetical protein [Candidatus Poseidoniaceae archaeon]